ncbi:MAG: hypothetical protein AABW63_03505 [Nanoarchaeota archaeon]
MKKRMGKKSQVWVETVIYTLIALSIIGLFLSFARPKIEEIQDKSTVEQSVSMLESIDSIILNIVQGGPGNQRVIEIGLQKGSLDINSTNDQIVYELTGRYGYTEPGNYVNIGKLVAITEKEGSLSRVRLISNYSNIYNITYNGLKQEKIIPKSPVPYRLSISNKGTIGNMTNIDFLIV